MNQLVFKHYASVLAAVVLLAGAAQTHAGLVINPTFDSSITSDPNAATIEAGIEATIARMEAVIANPITVNIEFQEMGSGLGQSTTATNNLSYTQYLSDLQNNQTLSANDTIALAHLPAGPNNPVNGNAKVYLTAPLLRAIGESTLGSTGGGLDGTIGLNTALMNLSRTGGQDPNKYDLQAVAGHEIDEVLGIGGSGSDLYLSGSYTGQSAPTDAVGALDLFRYSAPGVRSFSLDPSSAQPYFSIDGGNTIITNFNQNGQNGADFGDWGTNASPQVQDAFGTPGEDLNIGPSELEAFDVVGYDLTPTSVPEPVSCLLFGPTAIGLFLARRRCKAKA